jgi:hypothetical protein
MSNLGPAFRDFWSCETGWISSIILCATLAATASLQAESYEALPVLRTSDLLPSQWLESPVHRVDPEVRLEEGLQVFVLRSIYGVEEVQGSAFLRKRVREVHAAASLSEKGVGGAAVEGLVDEATGTLKNLGSAVKNPVRTVLNIPKGIGSVVKGASGSMKNQVKDKGGYSGGPVRDWFDVSEPKLKLASELGVDPYTDFQPLQDQFKRLAGTSTVSGLGIRIIVPGDGIIGAAAKGEAARQLKDVYLTPPSQLLKENRSLLEGAGVSAESAGTFFASREWSPAEQSLLCREIAALGRPAGAEALLEAAGSVGDRTGAFHFLRSSELLFLVARQGTAIGALASFHGFPAAITAERRFVLPLALDQIFWTANADRLSAMLVDEARKSGCSGVDLPVSGRISERAASSLEAKGIRVLRLQR